MLVAQRLLEVSIPQSSLKLLSLLLLLMLTVLLLLLTFSLPLLLPPRSRFVFVVV